jgi:hypothetical protein
MRRAGTTLLTATVLVVGGTAAAAGPSREVVEPTATVRYLPTTIAGYNAGMGAGEFAASLVMPASLDGYINLRALRSKVTLEFDDLGALDGAAIPVSVGSFAADGTWSGAGGCVPVRQPWTISGFAVGTVLRVAVRGATDEYGSLVAGRCSGRAAGGTMTVTGAIFQPYGESMAASAYPVDSGCTVSTAALLPRETSTCTFTASAPGGWAVSYDGPGVFAGDYVTDVAVTITRDRTFGTSESRYTDECGTGLIQAGDRVTVTIRQYDSGYSQHSLRAGEDAGC